MIVASTLCYVLLSVPYLVRPVLLSVLDFCNTNSSSGTVRVLRPASAGALFHFSSHSMNPAKRKYPTHERKLLFTVLALQTWRVHLYGSDFAFLCRTAHRLLQNFLTQANQSSSLGKLHGNSVCYNAACL